MGPMRFNFLIENPILTIGVLMVLIFLYQYGAFESRKEKLTPSSCRSAHVKLKRRVPKYWSLKCVGNGFNDLKIMITPSQIPSAKHLKAFLYRHLANAFIHVARHSPSDNLERIDLIHIKIIHHSLEISGISRGNLVVKLATLSEKKLVLEHFKNTVQVQEHRK